MAGKGLRTLPSPDTGDILYAPDGTQWSDLPAGSNGEVLLISTGVPGWGAAGSVSALDDLTDVDTGVPDNGDLLYFNSGAGNWETIAQGDGGGLDADTVDGQHATAFGDVTGPGSSTDNAIARWDGTGGDTIQNSSVIIDDSNNVSGMESLTFADDKQLQFGDGTEFWIKFDSTNQAFELWNKDGLPALGGDQDRKIISIDYPGNTVILGAGGNMATSPASDVVNLDVEGIVGANSLDIGGTEVIDSSRNGTLVDLETTGGRVLAGQELTATGAPHTLDTSDHVVFADVASGGTFTVNLPASPNDWQRLYIKAFDDRAFPDTLTVGRNGNNINGAGSDLTLGPEQAIVLIFTPNNGWHSFPHVPS